MQERDDSVPRWRCVKFTASVRNQVFEPGAVVRSASMPTRPDGQPSKDWMPYNAAARAVEAAEIADRGHGVRVVEHRDEQAIHRNMVNRPPFAGLAKVGADCFGNPRWGHADVRKPPPIGDVPLFKFVGEQWGFIGSTIRRKGETFSHTAPLSDDERATMVPLNELAQRLYDPEPDDEEAA